MSVHDRLLSRRWSADAIFKAFLLLLIAGLAMRLAFRSQQKERYRSPLEELDASIVRGDLQRIDQLLAQKINLNSEASVKIWDRIAFFGTHTPALNPVILQKLLDHGGSPNSLCSGGTPLLVAVTFQPKIVKLLLARGAKADARDKSGRNALFNHVNDVETMRLLINAGADIHARAASGVDDYGTQLFGQTLLMVAAQRGSVETLRLLLDKGMSLHDKDSNGATALLLAVESNSLEVVRLLLERGADFLAVDKQGRTALNYALNPLYGSNDRSLVLAEMFLKKGVAYHPDSKKDSSLLMILDKRRIMILLRCGVDVNVRDTGRATMGQPLQNMRQPLQDMGQPMQTPTGNTVLIRTAIMQNQPLLDHVPLNVGGTQGRRAQLARAIRRTGGGSKKFTEIAELLLKNKADPNIANYQGWTPLLAATANNNVPLVKMLLAHGANIHQSMSNGVTPLRIAQSYGYTEIEQLLLKIPNVSDKIRHD